MASFVLNVAAASGFVAVAGGVMNFTRPAAEVEVVTSMANRYDIMFGKKKLSSTPAATAEGATKSEASAPATSTPAKTEEKGVPKIGGDTGKPSPPVPFEVFGYRPSKLPGPPKPYDPTKAF